jgi:hypothetical protein
MNKMAERTLKKINTDRRRFLEMLSKYGVSTSVLKASSLAGAMMGARFAEAQDSQKKFILIYHPNGSPNGRYLNGIAVRPFQSKPWSNTVANLEITISQPGGHGNLWLAAGAQSYNSNDAHSSSVNMQAAKVLGNLTPFRSMQLGVKSLNEAGIDRLNGAAVTRINSPQTAFQQYFSSAPPPTTGTGGASITEKRLDVLNANKEALDYLTKNVLGQEEIFQLQTHLNTLSDLEARLIREREAESGGGGGGGGGGGSCASPSLASGASPLQEYKAQGDIAVAALACGLTNVASIQFNETQASWVPADGTADAVNWTADHHQANHGNGSAMLPAIIEYMNKGVAHVIEKLIAAGIYDKTVVLVISEMGDGQDHSAGSGPITVASGMGLKSGQRAAGGNHYAVFADVFRMLGLTPDGRNVYNYGSGGIV